MQGIAVGPGAIEALSLSRWDTTGLVRMDDLRGCVAGTITVAPARRRLPPTDVHLWPPYPNPFNPRVRIRFRSGAAAEASLVVIDVLGRNVRTLFRGRLPGGEHTLGWDGRDDTGAPVAAGVYYLRFQAGARVVVRKLVLLR